jgi:hypothetical protein
VYPHATEVIAALLFVRNVSVACTGDISRAIGGQEQEKKTGFLSAVTLFKEAS